MKIKGKEWSIEEIKFLHEHCSEKQEFCKKLGYSDGKHYSRIIQRIGLNSADFGKESDNYYGKPVKINDVFGKLVVKEVNVEQTKHGDWKSLCLCECGEECIIRNVDLKNGNTKSCGCLSGHNAGNQIKNGDIFGALQVIDANCEYSKNTTRSWLMSKCKCECGNLISVRNCTLRNRKYLSCGCKKSRGEEKISKILNENNIQFKTQYSFSDLKGEKALLRFDFAIFENDNLKCLIEYQGEQHYYPSFGYEKFEIGQKYDKLKREYCKNHNLCLIEIPYTDFQKLDKNYLKQLNIF